ncbi:MAG: CusA/CzcA family heavy metal efflux RND transporter [Chitinophagales bacterium]
MLERIIAFSIKNKLLISLCTVALIVWGVWSAFRLPIDALPDITDNQVQIITQTPTLAAQETEQFVTSPIERTMANLPDVEQMRSFSRFGLSVITIVFKDDVNIYFARQLISERLKLAEKDIPPSMGRPELAPVTTGLGEIYQYVIHPKKGSENKYSAMDLRTMQDWIVSRQLSGIEGVAEVTGFGGITKQYEVSVNPDRLKAMDVSIPEIFTALERNNENTGGAYIDKKPNAYFIRGLGMIKSIVDIENINVKNAPNGTPILIKDVAKVQFGSPPRYGAMTYNGEKEVVGGLVLMLKGANSAQVVKLVKERMQTVQASLPEDVIIEPFLDRSNLVSRAIKTVETNLIEGALIVIFVLLIFLGNFRAGLVVASAIPLSLLFALGMMNLFGVSANLMSLGAIDFGLIVDGAVIIVESVFHQITHSRVSNSNALTKEEMDETVLQSAKRMMSSAAFGQFIILIVYLPILTLVGIEGKMFGPMAQTVAFAILGAFILSLTYIPMMSSFALSRKTSGENISDKMMKYLQRGYQPLLQRAIRLRFAVVGVTVVLFAVSIYLFSNMGGEFIPTLEEGDYAIEFVMPQGTSLGQTVETVLQAERILRTFPEVKMVVGKTGAADVATDPMPMNASDLMVILKDKKEWTTTDDFYDLAEKMKVKLDEIPGVIAEPSQPIQMRFNELMTGVRQDVAIKIFGENLDTLAALAPHVAAMISDIKGVSEPIVERTAGLPQITIEYDRARLAGYGLNIEDVNHVVSSAFAGEVAGMVFENERKFELAVRLDSASRTSLNDVSDLFIPTANGNQIPLSQVASVTFKEGAIQISRERGKRRVVVGFNVADRDVASVVHDIQEKMGRPENKLPSGYYVTYGGTFENLEKASARLMVAVPVALALIFVLLYFTFGSIKQATLIYTAIPMSAIGGIFALLLRGMPFSISAGVGFIALFGVAVLNGIVLISTFNQLERDGMTDAIQRILEGTKTRLRPVLMTATVASLGFLPMAISHGAGAEVQKPLATVVIGGLITATFLTLFVLPLLYLIFSKRNYEPMNVKGIAVAIALLATVGLQAQSPQAKAISLEQATDIAIKNNLQIQSAQLGVQSSSSMRKSVFELPKTNFNFQYGQYNSINKDNSFQLSQQIPFPTYYSARAGLYKAELQSAQYKQQSTANEVKAQVHSLYYRMQYLQQALQQLQRLDSLYGDFVKAAGLRYKTGETNLLEKTTAETKRGELRLQLGETQTAISSAYTSLKSWMNYYEEFSVATVSDLQPLTLSEGFDTAMLANNPAIKLLYQNAVIAEKNKKLEAAQTLPDFSIGYFNQSLIGVQNINGSDVYFGGSKRFQGLNAGISIPLTFISNAAKVKSLKLQEQSLLREADNNKLSLSAELQNAFAVYNQHLAQYNYYKATALPNAETIINTATVNYKSGGISYVEYLQALQTAADVQLNYLATVDQLNQAVVNINFLIAK